MVLALWLVATVARAQAPPIQPLALCMAALQSPGITDPERLRLLESGLVQSEAKLRDLKHAAVDPESAWRWFGRAIARLRDRPSLYLSLSKTSNITLGRQLEARVAAAQARMEAWRVELRDLPAQLIPRRELAVGEDEVRAALGLLKARSITAQRDLDLLRSTVRRPRWRPVDLDQIALTTVMTTAYGALAYATAMAAISLGHHHFAFATLLVPPGMFAFLFGRGLVARINRFYLNLRGVYEALPFVTTNGDVFAAGERTLREIDDMLKAVSDRTQPDSFILSSTRVDLPLRQWDAYRPIGAAARGRRAPSVQEILNAGSTYGWQKPADARRLELNLLLFKRDGIPILIQTLHEAPYLQDHR